MVGAGIMAHFAKVENGIVTNVLVLDNAHEASGQDYLNGLGLEGVWIQTSYNGNIRVKYAGIGDVYNETKDRFEPAKKHASWVWNEQTYSYESPIPYPSDGEFYEWSQEALDWVIVEGQ